MRFETIQRRHPDRKWDYKAISTMVFDDSTYRNNDVIFYTLTNHGKKSRGVEIYSGQNYVVGSSDRSYSRRYSLSNVPLKYKNIVRELIRVHKKTNWSNDPYVNLR